MESRSSLLPPEPLAQRISRLFAWAAGACILFGCGLLVSLDVITRAIFRRGVIESFEISGYAFAAAVGLGMAFAVASKSHIRVDIALGLLPRKLRAPFDLIASAALAAVALALAWFCWGVLDQSIAMNAKSVSTMQTPMALPQSVWFAGLFWFAAMSVIVPVQALLRLLAGDRAGFEALVGSLRVDEEIEQAGVDSDLAGGKRP
ncbi:MAG: TRAP transporter small permease subunit [Tagaea sp.]|jgi:TRAP-type C4-dicarboxylate transport system permease small subunit|nr:TRAP transporter small permease [Azospirillum sp.]MCZ8122463.1 TRAP transporter small permease [Magnetospirillum sp.]